MSMISSGGPEKYDDLSGFYRQDLACLKEIFQDDDPIQFREMRTGTAGELRVCLVFCDGLVETDTIDNHLIRPMTEMRSTPKGDLEDALLRGVFQVVNVKKTVNLKEIIEGITYGDTLLLMDGVQTGLLFSTKKFAARSVMEPEGEKILSGPREGFTEVLITNLSLVRRRLRTEKLKMRYHSQGERTHTQLCIAYISGIVNPETVKELQKRLEAISIDAILDANYMNELIRDNPLSPFRSIGYTERPDVVAAKLLEGRVAIFIDGSPVVLTAPYLFIENFQSNEDYYLSSYYTSFSRMLRIIGFFITTFLPAFYVSIVAFHQEMLPSQLMISIAIEQRGVPFPAAVEAFILSVVFEILRETALRVQTNVGQTLGIVGAIVVGQAAVEAKLISAPMIIIVAMTGITSLLVPKMNAPILWIRFGILILASCLGFLGITIGVSLLLVHVLSLRSFGIWQLFPDEKLSFQRMKDTVVRAPWPQMLLRPDKIAEDGVRQKKRQPEETP